MGIDDLFDRMQQDELADALELAKTNPELLMLTPINYARARGILPQKVYAAIRNGRLEKKRCPCGRPTVDVEVADILFGFAKLKEPEAEPEVLCPHGCGPLNFVEDQWYCPKCKNEWTAEEEE